MSRDTNLLLIEDDAELAQWMSEYLSNEGFSVTHFESGEKAKDTVKRQQFDLVLLDIMLPGIDGIEVCRQIRSVSDIPIIMLTAKGDEFDEVIGLEVGANDYVIKPVRPRALLARIKSFLRVSETQQPDMVLKFGDLSIDNSSKTVNYRNEEITLSTGLFDLLWLLASQSGTIISRDQVFLSLRGREYDGLDRRYDVMISTLRKKLDDNPQNPKKIKTIWGKGYLFVADAWTE